MASVSATATVDEIVELLDRDGHVVVEGLLDRDETGRIRRELARILEAVPTGRNRFEGHHTKRLYAIFAKTRAVDCLAIHPLMLGTLDRVLGQYQLSAPTGIEIGPEEVAQALHRDDGVYPVPDPHDELVANIMWALDDFTEANGATRVVPGSHRGAGARPDRTTPTVAVERSAGSVMIYLGSLWHGGGANCTDCARLGVAIEYAASWLRPQETQLLAVPPEIVGDLPERLQELLGYNIYPPFLGYVDGRHPRRLLERRPTPQGGMHSRDP